MPQLPPGFQVVGQLPPGFEEVRPPKPGQSFLSGVWSQTGAPILDLFRSMPQRMFGRRPEDEALGPEWLQDVARLVRGANPAMALGSEMASGMMAGSRSEFEKAQAGQPERVLSAIPGLAPAGEIGAGLGEALAGDRSEDVAYRLGQALGFVAPFGMTGLGGRAGRARPAGPLPAPRQPPPVVPRAPVPAPVGDLAVPSLSRRAFLGRVPKAAVGTAAGGGKAALMSPVVAEHLETLSNTMKAARADKETLTRIFQYGPNEDAQFSWDYLAERVKEGGPEAAAIQSALDQWGQLIVDGGAEYYWRAAVKTLDSKPAVGPPAPAAPRAPMPAPGTSLTVPQTGAAQPALPAVSRRQFLGRAPAAAAGLATGGPAKMAEAALGAALPATVPGAASIAEGIAGLEKTLIPLRAAKTVAEKLAIYNKGNFWTKETVLARQAEAALREGLLDPALTPEVAKLKNLSTELNSAGHQLDGLLRAVTGLESQEALVQAASKDPALRNRLRLYRSLTEQQTALEESLRAEAKRQGPTITSKSTKEELAAFNAESEAQWKPILQLEQASERVADELEEAGFGNVYSTYGLKQFGPEVERELGPRASYLRRAIDRLSEGAPVVRQGAKGASKILLERGAATRGKTGASRSLLENRLKSMEKAAQSGHKWAQGQVDILKKRLAALDKAPKAAAPPPAQSPAPPTTTVWRATPPGGSATEGFFAFDEGLAREYGRIYKTKTKSFEMGKPQNPLTLDFGSEAGMKEAEVVLRKHAPAAYFDEVGIVDPTMAIEEALPSFKKAGYDAVIVKNLEGPPGAEDLFGDQVAILDPSLFKRPPKAPKPTRPAGGAPPAQPPASPAKPLRGSLLVEDLLRHKRGGGGPGTDVVGDIVGGRPAMSEQFELSLTRPVKGGAPFRSAVNLEAPFKSQQPAITGPRPTANVPRTFAERKGGAISQHLERMLESSMTGAGPFRKIRARQVEAVHKFAEQVADFVGQKRPRLAAGQDIADDLNQANIVLKDRFGSAYDELFKATEAEGITVSTAPIKKIARDLQTEIKASTALIPADSPLNKVSQTLKQILKAPDQMSVSAVHKNRSTLMKHLRASSREAGIPDYHARFEAALSEGIDSAIKGALPKEMADRFGDIQAHWKTLRSDFNETVIRDVLKKFKGNKSDAILPLLEKAPVEQIGVIKKYISPQVWANAQSAVLRRWIDRAQTQPTRGQFLPTAGLVQYPVSPKTALKASKFGNTLQAIGEERMTALFGKQHMEAIGDLLETAQSIEPKGAPVGYLVNAFMTYPLMGAIGSLAVGQPGLAAKAATITASVGLASNVLARLLAKPGGPSLARNYIRAIASKETVRASAIATLIARTVGPVREGQR